MKRAKAYFSIFKIKTAEGLQYRLSWFSGATVSVFWGFIYITIYRVFYLYADNTQAGFLAGMNLSGLVTYVWLSQGLYVMQPMNIDGDILKQIVSGDVGIEMCRPLNIYNHWFAKIAANRFIQLLCRGLLVSAFGFLIPPPYRASLPASLPGFLCALLSTFSAFLLCSAYAALIAAIRLGVTWGEGPTYLLMLMGGILSGTYLPLQLWPDPMQRFLLLQPFAGYTDIPIRLYIGTISPKDAIFVLGIQLIWFVLFVFIGRMVMNRQMHKIIIQGG